MKGKTKSKSGATAAAAAASSDSPLQNHDWFLAELVRLAELGFHAGITLTVGGATITGRLVEGKTYFEKTAAVATAGLQAPELATIRTAIFDMISSYTKMYDDKMYDDATEARSSDSTQFIHLKDARVITVPHA